MPPITPDIKTKSPQRTTYGGPPTLQPQNEASNTSILLTQKDSVILDSKSGIGNLNDVIAKNQRLRNFAQNPNGNSGGQLLFGEQAGKFHEARANSKFMHKWADQTVDRKGPFHPKSLFLRTTAVMYDMSPAPVAQEAGDAYGDPTTSKTQKVWATTKLGLQFLEAVPVAKSIGGAADGLKALGVGSKGSRPIRQSMGLVGSMRRRQSAAGFAKIPGKAKTAAAGSQAARQVGERAQKVANMDEFFETTDLGKALFSQSQRTGRNFHGTQIYKTTGKVKIGKTKIGKGFHYYLDNNHKDHIEVFGKQGKIKDVLDFKGQRIENKFKAAQGRSIKGKLSYDTRNPQDHLLA